MHIPVKFYDYYAGRSRRWRGMWASFWDRAKQFFSENETNQPVTNEVISLLTRVDASNMCFLGKLRSTIYIQQTVKSAPSIHGVISFPISCEETSKTFHWMRITIPPRQRSRSHWLYWTKKHAKMKLILQNEFYKIVIDGAIQRMFNLICIAHAFLKWKLGIFSTANI